MKLIVQKMRTTDSKLILSSIYDSYLRLDRFKENNIG